MFNDRRAQRRFAIALAGTLAACGGDESTIAPGSDAGAVTTSDAVQISDEVPTADARMEDATAADASESGEIDANVIDTGEIDDANVTDTRVFGEVDAAWDDA